MPNPTPNLQDKLLLSLGSPGRFQVFLFILLCTNAYPITFNFIAMTWFKTAPPFHCKVPDNDTTSLSHYIPLKSANSTEVVQCKMYQNPNNHSMGTRNCDDYEYGEKSASYASQWNLVCDEESFASLTVTIFFAGVMFGGLIFGTIADKFGRKPVVLFTLYGQAVLGFAIFFSPNYVTFIALKFVQGACLQGLQSSNNSLVMEMFPLRYRTIAGMILAMCATSGHMMLAGLFYFIPYWDWFQLTITCMTGLTVFYTWLYPESIRWLLSQDKQQEALATVQRFAKCNKITLDADISNQLKEISRDIISKANNVTEYDIRDLFKTSLIRLYSIALAFCWLAASVTYYGIQNFIPKMKYKHWNLFMGGALETVARLVGYFIIARFGRRRPLIFFYAMAGVFCIITGLVADFLTNYPEVRDVLAVLGKLGSAQCFAVNAVYASEIFPTVVRTIGLGMVACFARIGAMIAPQILDLKNVVSLWLPFIIFGSLSIISAIILFFLPETLNVALPNTIEDVEVFRNLSAQSSPRGISIQEIKEGGVDNPALDVTPKQRSDRIVNTVEKSQEDVKKY